MERVTALQLFVALAVGAIIGVERGFDEEARREGRPGMRTFAVTSLLGGVVSLFHSEALAVAAFAGVGFVAVAGYVRTSATSPGYTTEIALLLAFALGYLAGSGQPAIAVGAAVIVALVLGLKTELYGALARVERAELLGTFQLLLVAAVVLPLMPDEEVLVPGFNPYLVSWFVLLILGLSWLGYVSVRVLGDRLGILLTALFGGFTSSTAVTLSFSRMAAQQSALGPPLGRGILIACATMPLRLFVVLAVVNLGVAMEAFAALLVLGMVPLAIALAGIARAGRQTLGQPLRLSNPLDLKSAAVFAAVITLLFVAVPWFERQFGNAGIYALAAVSGLADVDAISLALARKADGGFDAAMAAMGIVIAAIANTFAKFGIAVFAGGKALPWRTLAILPVAAVAAAAVHAVVVFASPGV